MKPRRAVTREVAKKEAPLGKDVTMVETEEETLRQRKGKETNISLEKEETSKDK